MTMSELEAQRLESLAADYRSRGYDVTLHPDHSRLPEKMFGCPADMVADSPGDKVVVGLFTPASFNAVRMKLLAEYLETQRPWRYEAVFVSFPTAPDVPAQEELADDEQVARFIANGELLAMQNQTEAAALLLWSAAEALLRRRARSSAPEIERQSSARVLKHLYSLGEVESHVYEHLLELMVFRNAIAHGFAPRAAAPRLTDVVSDVRRLQAAA